MSLGGITRSPDSCWMEQVARNATMEGTGYLNRCRYLLHDRDTKFCREFRETLAAGGVKCLALAARSPNLKSGALGTFGKRGVPRLILFGEQSLRRVVSNFLEHFNQSSGQGQSALIPHRHDCICNSGYRRSPWRAAWWLAQALQPRGRNSLPI